MARIYFTTVSRFAEAPGWIGNIELIEKRSDFVRDAEQMEAFVQRAEDLGLGH